MTVVESWIEGPLRQFVSDAGAELALLLHPSGQVLAQHGFARAVDVMSACALAAGIHASAGELGKLLDGKPFRGLHHVGRDRQIFLAEALWPRGTYIFLTVFGPESSLGLVRLYFDELVAALAAAAPKEAAPTTPALAEHFERDLNRNLAVLFGRA
ncbi:MAG TPA: roadblock/LC7 domain-containing protein [Gemmatimonadaceae bacterium]|nr:roadblock/LC7 domain-containing protein [Gemmatimonadaceae bacterium]